MSSGTEPSSTADREIVISRVFAAPRALVYKAFTDPVHVGRWWGPNGFSITTEVMDLRVGGVWRYVMHGPDGVDYPNWTRYLEVVPGERLVYDHGGDAEGTPVQFQVTVTFVEVAGKTVLTMRSVFPTKEARDFVVENYGAIEGGRQTLARFAEHLWGRADTVPVGIGARVFRFVRTFAAPRALVFRAWTEPVMLARWWGPHHFSNPRCEFDARPGGAIRIDMRGPDGVIYPMGGTVHEVTPPERLAFTSSAIDGQGVEQLLVFNQIGFVEQAGATTVTVEATVLFATETGEMYLQGMEAGWTQSLDRLGDALVAAG